MRYLVSPDFSAKVAALTRSDIDQVARFLSLVEASDRQQLIMANEARITLLAQDVYVARLGSVNVYLTLSQDDGGEYALMLDATAESSPEQGRSAALFAVKNPKTNSALNPRLNTAINPRFNTAINPRFNTAINPRFNTAINPRFNTAINPRFNTALNPRFNTGINPRFNTGLNPRFNSAINPRLNRAFGGPFLYSLELVQNGYLVRASDNVDLLFDTNGNHTGELVKATDKIRVQFDKDGKWQGYFVRANDDVALQYTESGDWTGLLI